MEFREKETPRSVRFGFQVYEVYQFNQTERQCYNCNGFGHIFHKLLKSLGKTTYKAKARTCSGTNSGRTGQPITSKTPTGQSDHLNPPNDHTQTETNTVIRQKRYKSNNPQATGDKATPPNNLELLMKEIMILMTKMEDYITHLAQVNEIWTDIRHTELDRNAKSALRSSDNYH